MKKNLLITVSAALFLAAATLLSCDSDSGNTTASDEAHLKDLLATYWEIVKTDGFEEAEYWKVDYSWFATTDAKDAYLSDLDAHIGKMESSISDRDGVSGYEITDISIDKEHGSAELIVEITYGDGSTSESIHYFVYSGASNFLSRGPKWWFNEAEILHYMP